MFLRSLLIIATAILSWQPAQAQTYSACNPLFTTSCPANTALGKAINVDFTKGSVESFTASGNPTYDSSGAHFTVAKAGDAPQLTSLFYIMFGKVSITMKSAPGAGIVSTLVLQSDTLDEIDMEWLGADDTEVQTNYFGKGDVTTYNRGAFNPAANNQGQFITYDIEWTQSQITWSVGGKVVRVLTPATADANQYPQSPMQVKFGSWSGGDAATNAPGTIEWARGPTDWSKGPFTMSVSSIQVVDYSTGTQYKYGDTSGSWQSIQAVGGKVNGNAGGAGTVIASADAPAITSASPAIPAGLGSNTHTDTAHQTGWPWVGTSTFATVTTVPTTASLPSGWIITSSGKVMPASSAAVLPTSTFISLVVPSPSPSSPLLAGGLETIVGWDDRGFPTTRTLPIGFATVPVSYNQQGFPVIATPPPIITPSPSTVAAAVSTAVAAQLSCASPPCTQNKALSTTTSKAAGAKATAAAWSNAALFGVAVVLAAERVLL